MTIITSMLMSIVMMTTCVAMEDVLLHDQEHMSSNGQMLTACRPLALGGIIGAAEVTANQGLAAKKIAAQEGIVVPTVKFLGRNFSDPRFLYRSWAVNAASMAPITAVQVRINSAFLAWFTHGGDQTNMAQQVSAACMAGIASAAISGPCELVMRHQQSTGDSFVKTVAALTNTPKGSLLLYRGFTPTAVRDGGFTAGYLALGKQIGDCIPYESTTPMSKVVKAIIGGVPAGVAVALITHPFDTVKAKMQADTHAQEYKNMLDVVKKVYAIEGAQGFFPGVELRTKRVVRAIALMNALNEWLK